MKKLVLALAGITVLGVSAYAYYTRQVKLLSQMAYDISDIHIVGLNGNTITITVKIKFTSTADLEVKIKSLNLDLYLNGVYAGNTSTAGAFIIPAHGYNFAVFNITLSLDVVVSNIVSLISSGNLNQKFVLVTKGTVGANSGFINAKLPIEFTYPFTIADLLTKK